MFYTIKNGSSKSELYEKFTKTNSLILTTNLIREYFVKVEKYCFNNVIWDQFQTHTLI